MCRICNGVKCLQHGKTSGPDLRQRGLYTRLKEKEHEADEIKRKETSSDEKTQCAKKVIETAKAESEELLRTLREVPPTHYLLHIESFEALVTCLNKTGLHCYRSKDFLVGYMWKLLLYPGIEKEEDGKIYLSLQLTAPPLYSRIRANVIFFLYDQREKKYLSIQEIESTQFNEDNNWQSKRFPIISLKDFKDASDRYLVNDKCIFGVEVFILENRSRHYAVFRTLKETNKNVYIWDVKKPYDLMGGDRFSPAFRTENLTWNLHVYSSGNGEEKYLSISLRLPEDQNKENLGQKVYVEFKLSLSYKDRKISKRGKAWFSDYDRAWGFPKFIKWDDLGQYDEVEIEAQIISMSMEMEKKCELWSIY